MWIPKGTMFIRGLRLLQRYYLEKETNSNFDFLKKKKKKLLKSLSPGQFLGCSNPRSYKWVLYYFNFERSYDVLKSKSLCLLLNKNINLSKNETESKPENPAQTFRQINVVVQVIYKSWVKSKIVMSWSLRKTKSAFFATFILSEDKFL